MYIFRGAEANGGSPSVVSCGVIVPGFQLRHGRHVFQARPGSVAWVLDFALAALGLFVFASSLCV